MTETSSTNSMRSADSRLIGQEYRLAITQAITAFNSAQVLDGKISVDLTPTKRGKVLCNLKTSAPAPDEFFNPDGGYFWTVVVCLNAAGSAASPEDAELLVKAEMAGIDIFPTIALFTKRVVKDRENHQRAWVNAMEEISEAYLDKTNLT